MNRGRQRGFTIPEVIVAIFLLALAIILSGETLLVNLRNEKDARQMDEATKIASSSVDLLRSQLMRNTFTYVDDNPVTTHEVLFNGHYIKEQAVAKVNVDGRNKYRCDIRVYKAASSNAADMTKAGPSLIELVTEVVQQVEY
ncbi:MAG: type IV pilus modification PilV family protein [Bacillota bacterium]